MRRLAVLVCCLSCAEWRMPPTFPEQAAKRPVVHEQALLGLSDAGAAAVLDLVDAEGEAPRLLLIAWGGADEPARTLLEAPPDRALAVAGRIRGSGAQAIPLLAIAAAAGWPEAAAVAQAQGFLPRPAADPEPGQTIWHVDGAPGAGTLPLLLQAAASPQPATVLLLGDGAPGEAVEIARMPLAGKSIEPRLWVRGGVAWMLAGSVLPGEPLRRAVGLRRASLRRGEAQLHNLHGLEDYRAGEIDLARNEFDRAMAADPSFFDALYNAGAAAAVAGRAEEAIALLRRAAAVDPARIQVVGRNDGDLESIRRRPEVRALLGMRRLPPEGVPPPP